MFTNIYRKIYNIMFFSNLIFYGSLPQQHTSLLIPNIINVFLNFLILRIIQTQNKIKKFKFLFILFIKSRNSSLIKVVDSY